MASGIVMGRNYIGRNYKRHNYMGQGTAIAVLWLRQSVRRTPQRDVLRRHVQGTQGKVAHQTPPRHRLIDSHTGLRIGAMPAAYLLHIRPKPALRRHHTGCVMAGYRPAYYLCHNSNGWVPAGILFMAYE